MENNKNSKDILLFITIESEIHDENLESYKNDSCETIVVKDYKNKVQTRTDVMKCKPIILEELNRKSTDLIDD